MTYYIDFDNTLFNTVSFYSDLRKIMCKYGIDDKKIECYRQSISGAFSPLKLIDNYIEKQDVDKEIIKDINDHFSKAIKYLYDDVLEFLDQIKKHNNKIVLLTYGNYDYQNRKIVSSAIDKYFDEIIITNKEKDSLNLDFKNGIFVDDNCKVIEKILLKKPYKVIRIKRLNNPYSKIRLNNNLVDEYNSLSDIKNY